MDHAAATSHQPRNLSFKYKIKEHWKTLKQMSASNNLVNSNLRSREITRIPVSELHSTGIVKPMEDIPSNTKSKTDEGADKKTKRNNSHKWGATFLNIVVEVLKFKKAGIPLQNVKDEEKTDVLIGAGHREWFQLGGHQGTFMEGRNAGWVMKQLCENEYEQYKKMQSDPINKIIPNYIGVCTMSPGSGVKVGWKGSLDTNRREHAFIEMEDLLAGFSVPNVMDIKMGTRTYTEEELVKSEKSPRPRKDLFLKMISIDENQPTEGEREVQAVLKSRYMIWRENLSSSATLGFRIEAIKRANDEARKEYHRLSGREEIKSHLDYFIHSSTEIAEQFRKRLKKIRSILQSSHYFKTHEFIGSSLLFVYDTDSKKNGIWMIDFAKTREVNGTISHANKWEMGNHEDGYMIGLNNLISIFAELSSHNASESMSRRRSSIGALFGERTSFSHKKSSDCNSLGNDCNMSNP